MPKIVDWVEFTRQPPGTVFWEYEPEIFINPGILVSFIDRGEGIRDFWMISLTPLIEHSTFDDEHEGNIALADAQERWGVYDYDQLFCVLSDNEKHDLVKRLKWHE